MFNKFKNKRIFFSNDEALKGELRYLKQILEAKVIYSCYFITPIISNYIIRWGLKPTNNGKLTEFCGKVVFKKPVYIEDGFIRSYGIGLSGDPTISVIYDDFSPYYDSTKKTSLEKSLNSDESLSAEQLKQSKDLIRKIVDHKISKYNNAPDFVKEIGGPSKPNLLLVDQRRGDYSVIKGQADESDFEKMLEDAVQNHPDHNIIIKTHPDSLQDGYSSYFTEELLSKYSDNKNIYLITEPCNPYSLIEKVDKVFVVTSFVGFEALMAGKEVHCYGIPFYANWGITKDQKKSLTRQNRRSLEEIFYYTYIAYSLYYNPDSKQSCDLSGAVDYMMQLKSSKQS